MSLSSDGTGRKRSLTVMQLLPLDSQERSTVLGIVQRRPQTFSLDDGVDRLAGVLKLKSWSMKAADKYGWNCCAFFDVEQVCPLLPISVAKERREC